jgi:hypothetical protein
MKRHHGRRRHHHHRHPEVWLTVGDVSVLLNSTETTHMASTFAMNQIVNLSIQALDASGNVLTGVVFDSPPAWTDDAPATATLVASADGTTAVLTPVAPGTLNVGLTAIVGGVSFTAALAETLTAAAPTVASVQIVATNAPLPTA